MKLFALTFFQNENDQIKSAINQFYFQENDFDLEIYFFYSKDYYNVLFESSLVRSHQK